MELFIGYMNAAIEKGKSLYLNTVLDGIPRLNDAEFKLVSKQAYENGWILTIIDDKYQTETYKLKVVE